MTKRTEAKQIFGLLLAILLLQPGLTAQAPPSQNIDASILYIVFLHQQAADAQARSSVGAAGASLQDKASRMHINTTDIPALDEAAKLFAAQESVLAQEALRYQRGRMAAHQPLDLAIIRSFTVRRTALANAALASIQSKLSPASYAGLQQFINSDIRNSIQTVTPAPPAPPTTQPRP